MDVELLSGRSGDARENQNETGWTDTRVHAALVLLMIIVWGILIVGLRYFQSSLIPFALAWLLAQLLGPFTAAIVRLGQKLRMQPPDEDEGDRAAVTGLESTASRPRAPSFGVMNYKRTGSFSVLSEASSETRSFQNLEIELPNVEHENGRCRCRCLRRCCWCIVRELWRLVWITWRLGALVVPIFLFSLVVYCVILIISSSAQNMDWRKYRDSERLRWMVTKASESGVPGINAEHVLKNLQQTALTIVNILFEFVEGSVLTTLFLAFFLVGWINQSDEEMWMPQRVTTAIRHYARLKTILSLAVGVLTAIVLRAFTVDLWVMWAVVAFLMNYIPTVGALAAVLLPVPLIVLDPNKSLIDALWVLLLLVMCHTVVGNVLEPRMFGHALELHPITVMLSLAIWSMIWGIVGTVMSVPLTVTMKILLECVPEDSTLKPYAEAVEWALEGRRPRMRDNNMVLQLPTVDGTQL